MGLVDGTRERGGDGRTVRLKVLGPRPNPSYGANNVQFISH